MANISELPDYGEKRAKYEADKREAEVEGDQDKLERVKFGWERETFQMQRHADEAERAAQRLEEAKAKAKAEFADVPEELYSDVTDPEKVLAIAGKAHEAIEGKRSEGASDWGGGAPATANAGGGDGRQEIPYDQYMDQKLREARRGNHHERKEHAGDVLDGVLQHKVFPSMGWAPKEDS